MKKSIIIVGILLFMIALACLAVPYIRTQYENAQRSVAYRQMNLLRKGVIEYRVKTGQLPNSLVELEPAYIDSGILDRKPGFEWMSKRTIVPPHPFGLQPIDRSFEITCIFYGKDYTQLVMDGSTGEVRVE